MRRLPWSSRSTPKSEVVADALVGKVLEVVEHAAKTSHIGDGKIFVTPVEEAVRIRTGERGEGAIERP